MSETIATEHDTNEIVQRRVRAIRRALNTPHLNTKLIKDKPQKLIVKQSKDESAQLDQEIS